MEYFVDAVSLILILINTCYMLPQYLVRVLALELSCGDLSFFPHFFYRSLLPYEGELAARKIINEAIYLFIPTPS